MLTDKERSLYQSELKHRAPVNTYERSVIAAAQREEKVMSIVSQSKAQLSKVVVDVKKWKMQDWGAFASLVAVGVLVVEKVKKKLK